MQNNKIKIVIDTNVFIYGTIPQLLIKEDNQTINIIENLLETDTIELVFSQDTIGELIYIFKNIIKHCVNDIIERESYMHKIMILFLNGYSINTTHTIAPRCADPNDNMFLKCAIGSNATYLISDDLKSHMKDANLNDTKVLTAKEFVDIYNNGNVQADDESETAVDETTDKNDK